MPAKDGAALTPALHPLGEEAEAPQCVLGVQEHPGKLVTVPCSLPPQCKGCACLFHSFIIVFLIILN